MQTHCVEKAAQPRPPTATSAKLVYAGLKPSESKPYPLRGYFVLFKRPQLHQNNSSRNLLTTCTKNEKSASPCKRYSTLMTGAVASIGDVGPSADTCHRHAVQTISFSFS